MKKNKMIAGCIQRTAISLAISVCFATLAQAQNADGTIYGHAKAKAQIQIVNMENGSARQIEAGKDGDFTVPRLPTGRYKVSSDGRSFEVQVVIGSGTEVRFDEIQSVTVTSSRYRNPIDVNSVESSSVFTKAEIQSLPVGRDATSIALLAPGTVKGDGNFGGLASFGGASVAENGYYINGFDVTNIRKFMSFVGLPFEALNEQQVKTGGYGAEFGRSLGGVISSTTKRGTNEWKSGVSAYWDNSRFAARYPTVKNLDPQGIKESNLYTVYTSPSNRNNNISYNAYTGGPLIKDKLFMFAMVEGRSNNWDGYGQWGSNSGSDTSPHGLLKLDWQINADHRMEFTGINNRSKVKHQNYDIRDVKDVYSTQHLGKPRLSTAEFGGDLLVGKYTGYLTDNLTLSAQIGRTYNLVGKFTNADEYGAECPAIYDRGQPAYGCWNPAHFTIRDAKAPDDSDTRKAKRIDLEYNIGDHTIRAGYDAQDFISTNAGYTYSGGIYYRYYDTPADGTINGVKGAGTPGTQYVRVRKFQTTSGSFTVTNDAMYVEDSWKATKNLMLYGGLRSESFDNKNADGVSFVNKKNLIAPRLGGAWDVNGDASLKIYGNAGRYFIPVASNANIRASSSEYTEGRFYNFSGKDPKTLAALNLGPEIGKAIIIGSLQSPNPATIADTELKPMSQDEFIMGFQKALNKEWSIGVKSVYRQIRNGMDDYCSAGGISQWAADKGYKNFDYNTIPTCMIVNPGRDLSLALDLNNDGNLQKVTIPASYLGLAKYSRTYKALELSVERPFDGKWGMSGSYVLSQSKGTAEGYVQSDLHQEDAGLTQDFDFGSFTHGSYGRTPNDRTHQIKLLGNYAINDNFRLGATANITSGRATSCIGFVPTTVADFYGPGGGTWGGSGGYTSPSSYYCLNDQGVSVLGHRGNGKQLPWSSMFNLDLTYIFKLANKQSITVQAKIYNIFNSSAVLSINQVRDYSRDTNQNASGNKLNPNYQQPNGFQDPRRVSLQARYEF